MVVLCANFFSIFYMHFWLFLLCMVVWFISLHCMVHDCMDLILVWFMTHPPIVGKLFSIPYECVKVLAFSILYRFPLHVNKQDKNKMIKMTFSKRIKIHLIQCQVFFQIKFNWTQRECLIQRQVSLPFHSSHRFT